MQRCDLQHQVMDGPPSSVRGPSGSINEAFWTFCSAKRRNAERSCDVFSRKRLRWLVLLDPEHTEWKPGSPVSTGGCSELKEVVSLRQRWWWALLWLAVPGDSPSTYSTGKKRIWKSFAGGSCCWVTGCMGVRGSGTRLKSSCPTREQTKAQDQVLQRFHMCFWKLNPKVLPVQLDSHLSNYSGFP